MECLAFNPVFAYFTLEWHDEFGPSEEGDGDSETMAVQSQQ